MSWNSANTTPESDSYKRNVALSIDYMSSDLIIEWWCKVNFFENLTWFWDRLQWNGLLLWLLRILVQNISSTWLVQQLVGGGENCMPFLKMLWLCITLESFKRVNWTLFHWSVDNWDTVFNTSFLPVPKLHPLWT